MRTLALALGVAAGVPLLMWACSNGNPVAPNPAPDGGVEAGPDGNGLPDIFVPPIDAAVPSCKLSSGLDPVGLCMQKTILKGQADAVFAAGVGTYASWDSTSLLPDKNDAGALVHDFHDDLAFAAALSNFEASAATYGDREFKTIFDDLIVKLEAIVEAEMAPLPAEYAGDVYRSLRALSGGLRAINHPAEAGRIDAIAEAYGRAILTFSHSLAGGGGDAGASDAGTTSDGVLGVIVAGGQIAYRPADVATGALALLDMAARHLGDDPAFSANAQTAALQAVDHVWKRGRDGATGMIYASLVTSNDPGHDALGASTTPLPNDALLLDVQATVALALARAQEVASGGSLSAAVKAYPFETNASTLVDACNGPTVSLWDGQESADAGAGGGYFEGYVPSTGMLLPNKPTRGNALMYGTLHRLLSDIGGDYPWQEKFLRPILAQRAPPMNVGLYSVVFAQNAFFRATSRDFNFATSVNADGGDAGLEPFGMSYTARAVEAVCEGFNEFWYRFHG